jgi:hypothetical protein
MKDKFYGANPQGGTVISHQHMLRREGAAGAWWHSPVLRAAVHHAFTTGLQATYRKHKCTLLCLAFLRDIFENRDVCETWERNCKEGMKSFSTTYFYVWFCMLFSNTVSGREVI